MKMGTIEKMFIALGTVNRIPAWFDAAERESARLALERAEEYINDMDDRLSVFKPDSEISRINENAGVRDTLYLLQALTMFYRTHIVCNEEEAVLL